MKRILALSLALVLCLCCTACRRTDSLAEEPTPAPVDPTPEPPLEAVYAEGFVTADPTLAPVAGEPGNDGPALIGAGEDLPDAEEGETPDEPEDPEDPGEPADPDAPGEPEPTAVPEEPDPYTYDSISNATLKVKFAYPQGWTSSPSTDVITMVEPVAEGEVPARVSVTSYLYTEAKPSGKKLKSHLGSFLVTALDAYNDYKVESTANVTFVGSTGLSATYLAIQGNNYVRGVVYAGYTKATKQKKGRVYILHFSCEDSRFEEMLPLAEKLAASVTEITG